MLDIIYLVAGILFIIVLLFAILVLIKLNQRINFVKEQEKLLTQFIENNTKFIKLVEKLNTFFASNPTKTSKGNDQDKTSSNDGIIDVIAQIDKHQGNIKKIIDKGKSLFGKKDK